MVALFMFACGKSFLGCTWVFVEFWEQGVEKAKVKKAQTSATIFLKNVVLFGIIISQCLCL